MNITRPFGIESANAPTNGANITYETMKKNFSSGVIQCRRLHLHEQRDRGDEQRIVGERREELRRHDDVETERHRAGGRKGSCRGLVKDRAFIPQRPRRARSAGEAVHTGSGMHLVASRQKRKCERNLSSGIG